MSVNTSLGVQSRGNPYIIYILEESSCPFIGPPRDKQSYVNLTPNWNIQVRKLEGSYESRENVEFHIVWTGMTVSFLAP